MRKRIFLIIFCVLLPQSVWATEWKKIDEVSLDGKDIFYIDQNSIARYRNIGTIWTKIVYGRKEASMNGKLIDAIHMKMKLDCAYNLYTNTETLFYGKNHQILAKYLDKNAELTLITPESTYAKIADIVCKTN